MDEVNKLFIIWTFRAILKKNTIKNIRSSFQHPLARAVALFIARTKKYLYASIFLSVIEKIVTFCRYFCLFSLLNS